MKSLERLVNIIYGKAFHILKDNGVQIIKA